MQDVPDKHHLYRPGRRKTQPRRPGRPPHGRRVRVAGVLMVHQSPPTAKGCYQTAT
jgi:hypothetical protein